MDVKRTVWASGIGLLVCGAAVIPAVGAFAPQKMAPGASQRVSSSPVDALQNGLGAANKARQISKEKGKRVAEGEALLEEETQPSGGLIDKALSPADINSAYKADKDQAEMALSGSWVKVNGIVVNSAKSGQGLDVTILPEGDKDAIPFIFRFPTQSKAFEPGSHLTLEGKFLYRVQGESGNAAYVVDASGQAGTEQKQAAEKTNFDQSFGGWRFVGSVQNAKGATGVFVRGDDTKYAQAGDKLDTGLKVVAVEAGKVVLHYQGKSSTMTPW